MAVRSTKDESLSSWITAVAARYRTSVGEFTRLIGIGGDAPWLNPFALDVEGAASPAARQLAAVMDVAEVQASELLTGLGAYCQLRDHVTTPQWSVVRPTRDSRYCPACLADSGGRWSKWWRVPWVTVCREHLTALVSGCPECGGPQRGRRLTQVSVAQGTGCDTWKRGRTTPDDRCTGDLTTARCAPATAWGMAFQEQTLELASGTGGWIGAIDQLRDVSAVRNALSARDLSNRARRPEGDLLLAAMRVLHDPDHFTDLALADVGTRPHALPRALRGASAKLEERVAALRSSHVRTADRLRWRTFIAATRPVADEAVIRERMRRMPSRLWLRTTLGLLPDDGPLTHTAVAVMGTGSILLVGQAKGPGSTPALQYAFRALRGHPLEDALFTSLVHVADQLDRGESPIDYDRRRDISRRVQLVSAEDWRQIARRCGVVRGGAPQLHAANAWVRELFTGNPFDACRHPVRWEQLVRFGLSLTPDAAELLRGHAESLLAVYGIDDEPLEWVPEAAPCFEPPPVDLDLARHHLRDDFAPFGGAAAAQRVSILRLWDAIRLDPPGLGLSTRSAPVGKHALPKGLTGDRIMERLTSGESLRGIATATGVSRQVLAKELVACGHPLPKVGRRTLPIPSAEWLAEEYSRRTAGDIGEDFGVSKTTVRRWLVMYRIPTRKRGAASHQGVVQLTALPEPLRSALGPLRGDQRLERFLTVAACETLAEASVRLRMDLASLRRQMSLLNEHLAADALVWDSPSEPHSITPMGDELRRQALEHRSTWHRAEMDK
jgi:hypothetical protein